MSKAVRSWMREAFSEKGIGSAKRLVGAFICVVTMGCIVYLTIKEGATPAVQDLLQTSMIVGASLLGLYSITSIWKGGKVSTSSSEKFNDEGTLVERQNEEEKTE